MFTLVLSFCAFDLQCAFADDEPAPIQDTYEVDGVTYFKIDSDAFAGSKAEKLIVKTKLLKKATVKGCLKGSRVKSVKVKVGKKSQNKKYVKKYKKIFFEMNY